VMAESKIQSNDRAPAEEEHKSGRDPRRSRSCWPRPVNRSGVVARNRVQFVV
jgi:hypothetical protein